MLDINTAKIIKQALDSKWYKNNCPLTLEDVCNMQPISRAGIAYTILASQYGDLTILVWVQFDEKRGVVVRLIKTLAW